MNKILSLMEMALGLTIVVIVMIRGLPDLLALPSPSMTEKVVFLLIYVIVFLCAIAFILLGYFSWPMKPIAPKLRRMLQEAEGKKILIILLVALCLISLTPPAFAGTRYIYHAPRLARLDIDPYILIQADMMAWKMGYRPIMLEWAPTSRGLYRSFWNGRKIIWISLLRDGSYILRGNRVSRVLTKTGRWTEW